MNKTTRSCVEAITLREDVDHRVAFAAVRIGDVLIRGVTVWRASNGSLRVYFPSYKQGSGFEDAIQLPEVLRTEVEADVIAAYKVARAEAVETRGNRASG